MVTPQIGLDLAHRDSDGHTAGDSLHPDVVWITRPDGSCRLMQMSGNVCALDKVATDLLKSILEIGVERSASDLAARYGVDEAQASEDVRTFAAALRKQNLIRPRRRPNSLPERSRNLAARAFIRSGLGLINFAARSPRLKTWSLLWAAKLAIANFGWSRSVREWERLYPQPAAEAGANAETDALNCIDRLVRETAARSLVSVECKERALTALALTREGGFSCQLIVGVTHHPLQGHVWVESGGRVISDNPEHCRPFQPVVRYG